MEVDKYKTQSVELLGWGSKSQNTAVSDSLKNITVTVLPMRSSIFVI